MRVSFPILIGISIMTISCTVSVNPSKEDLSNSSLSESLSSSHNSSFSSQTPFIAQPVIEADIYPARKALIKYFTLLHAGEYIEAVSYHGSGYEQLRQWNPNEDSNNYSTLLKNGCEMNGLQCLKIKTIISQKISDEKIVYIVQFENEDGTVFKQGPCCGATEEAMPTKTNFEFTVQKDLNGYLVMTSPVYVP